MKVIFLDVDGVLNNMDSLRRAAEANRRTWAIDKERLYTLKRIADHTSSKIVLSTDWRLPVNDPANLVIRVFLHTWGIPVAGATPCLDMPDRIGSVERAAEIREWLDDHEGEVEEFLIIDDRMDAGNGFPDNFIWIPGGTGLEEGHYLPAVRILNDLEPE